MRHKVTNAMLQIMRALISELESRLEEPTAKGLAHAVSRALREGVLQSGDQLPPIRTLAAQLTLSPTTVSAAWAMLTRAGALRTAGRRGTVVADLAAPREGRYRRTVDPRADFDTDLSTGVPDPRLLPQLTNALHDLSSMALTRSYLDDPLLPDLRTHLAGDWPYAAPALTMTDGAMDALDLVIRARLSFGDRVLVENPTFPAMLDLLESAGLVVEGVRIDAEGLVASDLAQALTRPAQAVFLQPRAQNPTGVAMTPARMAQLAEVLADSRVLIVEDDCGSGISRAADLSFGSVLPERTVHIRSFSKAYGPDLRLAAMSAPEDLIGQVQHLRQLGQGWSSRLLQRLLLNLLNDPATSREVAFARDEYARRRTTFAELLAAAGIRTLGSDGLNLWVPVVDETAAIMRLAANGVAVAPGQPFQVGPAEGRAPHIRVTVASVDADIEALAELVAAAAVTGPWSSTMR